MKILHADAGREMRGGQWQVLQLHAGLGVDSVLLCRAAGPLMQECRRRGIRAEPLSIAALAAQSRKADITHVHDARSHTWAAAAPGCRDGNTPAPIITLPCLNMCGRFSAAPVFPRRRFQWFTMAWTCRPQWFPVALIL